MAGCEWGRDCWGEMEHYKALSKKLHKRWWKFWGSRIVLCSVLLIYIVTLTAVRKQRQRRKKLRVQERKKNQNNKN